MGDIEFKCPACDGLLVIDEVGAGRQVKCNLCFNIIRVPETKPGMDPGSVKVSCPHCDRHLEVPEELFGSILDCPSCGLSIQMPSFRPKQPVTPPVFLFTYMALTKSKEKKTGSVTAPNRVEAIRALEQQGLLPISVSEPEAVPLPPVLRAASTNMGATPADGHSGSAEMSKRFYPVAVQPPLREPLMITLAESVPADAPGERFEVVRQNGETVTIASAERLREYILKSYFARNAQVRKVLVDEAGARTESTWTALEQLGDCRPSIDVLYRPVWHRTMKWLWYGVIGGIILKSVDTAVFMFEANESVGVLWVVTILGLGLSFKWPKAMWFAILISVGILKEGKLNVGVLIPTFGGALFSTVLIGSLFGALVGMIIGTIVGYCRASSGSRAPDALPEGNKPLTLGLFAPIGGLAVLIPIYIWLINTVLSAY